MQQNPYVAKVSSSTAQDSETGLLQSMLFSLPASSEHLSVPKKEDGKHK